MIQKKPAVIENVTWLLAAALALVGAVSWSWATPAPKSPPPPVSPFSSEELAQAEGECGKGVADFRKFYARFLGRPFEGSMIITSDSGAAGWLPMARTLACLDLAGDAKWSCRFLLPAKGRPSDPYLRCQESKVFPLFSKTVLRGGDAKALFPQLAESLWEDKAAGIPAPVKDKLFQGYAQAVRTGDALPLCADIAAAKLGIAQQECLQWAGFFTGDPGRCQSVESKPDREDCIAKASVLSVLRRADAKSCAALPWCDAVVNRQAAGCSVFIREANAVFCRAVAELTKGKAPPPVDTAKRDRNAKLAKEKALLDEAARKEKERVAEFHKKRAEEEKIHREKLVAAEYRLAQEAAAKKREQDDKVRQALEERKRKKQFRAGQRMDPGPLDAMKAIDSVNSGKTGPPAKEDKDE